MASHLQFGSLFHDVHLFSSVYWISPPDMLDHCDPDPCNTGTCFSEVGGYTCMCDDGHTGENCTDEINFCENSPCVNGQCTSNTDGYYECTCEAGYTGYTCARSE